MNEMYYIKQLFKCIKDKRILPIIWFFKYSIFLRIKFIFMSQEAINKYYEKRAIESAEKIKNLFEGFFPLAAGIVASNVAMSVLKESEKKKRDEGKNGC